MIPFKMIQETETEKWRAETFWTKEPETIAWIKTFKNGETFFDVGANVGIYSLYCALLNPDSLIVAIEPLPMNFNRLVKNISLNGFRNILPLNYAVGRGIRRVLIKENKNEIGTTASIDDTGDIFCYQIHLDVCNYTMKANYVKIDTDGSELAILRGMHTIFMSPHIKSILIEVNDDKEEIFDILKQYDFKLDSILNSLPNHSRFRREREGITAENFIFVRD